MDLSKLNLQDMLEVAVETAKMAGKILIDGQSSAKARRKQDGSMVTDMDYKAEGLIIKTLWRKFSRYCFGFLCEEHGKIDSQEYRWIVDPVDGTDLYIRGISGWSVMIAFEAEEKVLLGVIYDPVKRKLYSAALGRGAYCNGKRLRVSGVDSISEASLLYSGVQEALGSSYGEDFPQLLNCVRSKQEIGDCPGWMLIAEGKADIGLHFGLGPEDIAAPLIIIKEAGGKFSDLGGDESIHNGNALVTNGNLHAQVLKFFHPY